MSNSEATAPAAPKKVFVISPIGAKGSPERILADRFLNYVVRPALPEPEYKVERADEDDSAWAITEAMLRAIVEADLCVADITGRNPNVMYELAIAHAMDKRVIIMNSDGQDTPFDIKDQRALPYGIMPEEIDQAITQLRQKATYNVGPNAMTALMNPVATAFKAWTDLQKLDSETGTSEDALHRVVERLESKLDRAIHSPRTPELEDYKASGSPFLRPGPASYPAPGPSPRSMMKDRLTDLNALRKLVPPGERASVVEMHTSGLDMLGQGHSREVLLRWIAEADELLFSYRPYLNSDPR